MLKVLNKYPHQGGALKSEVIVCLPTHGTQRWGRDFLKNCIPKASRGQAGGDTDITPKASHVEVPGCWVQV